MTDVVLAKTYQETNAFARQKGLGYGVRHIVNKDTLRGSRPGVLHVLPSFYKRRDIHAINAEIRRIERKNPQLERVEYEKLPSGTWVVASESAETLDPPVNPQPAGKDVYTTPAVDTSKDAVPGQSSLAEFLADGGDLVIDERPDGSLHSRTVPPPDKPESADLVGNREMASDDVARGQEIWKDWDAEGRAKHEAEQNFRSDPDVLDFLDD